MAIADNNVLAIHILPPPHPGTHMNNARDATRRPIGAHGIIMILAYL
ncbi:MAG: hypothetical protein WCS03_03755 [Bacteroidota bacterium]